MFSRRIQFWTLLGPIFALLTLFLWLLKGDREFLAFPIGLIVGIPLIWRWGNWGLGPLLLGIAGVTAWAFGEVAIEERFWVVGMGISHALTFTIMALSLEEVRELTRHVEEAGKRHLDRALNLDDELKQLRKRIKAERKAWEDQLHWQQELAESARRDFLKVNKQKEQLEKGVRS